MSFPSGHSNAAFAGFGFLALYLNAKYGIFAHRDDTVARTDEPSAVAGETLDRETTEETLKVEDGEKKAQPPAAGKRTAHWRLGLFVLPLLLASILAASKVRDGWHHTSDVVAGALIGSAFALMAYKMVYRNVWRQEGNARAMD
jgi:diacylglycerol diphosphate phosphatase/phosphatidate phosphatase